MGTITLPSSFIKTSKDGQRNIEVLVEGVHCPSCVNVIETNLNNQSAIRNARLNLSTKRLNISWIGEEQLGQAWLQLIESLGYHAVPFNSETSETEEIYNEKILLRCLAIAGFATGNLMLFSVPLWSSDTIQMGELTRSFFHWIQALIAIPTLAYAGQPFFKSAYNVLIKGHTNMDVPISVAIILTTAMSLFEIITHGTHSYFDSIVMLVFFLLVGRYLEARARGRARSAARDLLKGMTGIARTRGQNGAIITMPYSDIQTGMDVLVATGEKIGADGTIIEGASEIDMSLITGETMPQAVNIGGRVFAGTLNISAPIVFKVSKPQETSLLAEIIRLMEVSEQSQAVYVTLADKISRWYTPVVHSLALTAFLGWLVFSPTTSWQEALLIAATVLIITCPCALGLAVPVVQVIAVGKLMKAGLLLKSGSALERMARVTHIVFDKTGTLTNGKPTLIGHEGITPEPLAKAARLAMNSTHPLSQALCAAAPKNITPLTIREFPGLGLEAHSESGETIRLGKRTWAAPNEQSVADTYLELWYAEGSAKPVRFCFADQLKPDAYNTVHALQKMGLKLSLLSGDRIEVTAEIAAILGIEDFQGALSPVEKQQNIARLKESGATVLMVGDGLNDAPSLAAASISMSPNHGIDIAQNAADIVFQGNQLNSILLAHETAKTAQRLVRQNFLLAIAYNIIAVPLAVMGMVTPLIAAIAMSSSSLLVVANSARLYLSNK